MWPATLTALITLAALATLATPPTLTALITLAALTTLTALTTVAAHKYVLFRFPVRNPLALKEYEKQIQDELQPFECRDGDNDDSGDDLAELDDPPRSRKRRKSEFIWRFAQADTNITCCETELSVEKGASCISLYIRVLELVSDEWLDPVRPKAKR